MQTQMLLAVCVALLFGACAGSDGGNGGKDAFVPFLAPDDSLGKTDGFAGDLPLGDPSEVDTGDEGVTPEGDLPWESDGGLEVADQISANDTNPPCQPQCFDKECGDDGCGGSCGTCPAVAPLCIDYKCNLQCVADCLGKECGEDGCGHFCGFCDPGFACDGEGQCQPNCQADCLGKECGDDGCGGSCGGCPQVAPLCVENLCQLECIPDCLGKQCGFDGCEGDCGACPEGLPLCIEGNCLTDPDESCTEAGKQVFLVTEANVLLRFEPLLLNVVTIGPLNCPANFGETPFSMSVDRNSFAWVLYGDGSVYKVNTENAACSATAFAQGQSGFDIFGMGFSTDGPGTNDETLFIAGGPLWSMSMGNDATLGSVDLETLSVSSHAPFAFGSGLPELTGNRSAELWGFFAQASPPRIARIDKNTAAQSATLTLPPALFADVQAWAFAYWGGNFYIFFKSTFGQSSGIWRVLPTGDVVTEVASTGHVITGAGVSTCAPTEFEL